MADSLINKIKKYARLTNCIGEPKEEDRKKMCRKRKKK